MTVNRTMKCTQTVLTGDQEYRQRFKNKVEEQRIPISGSLDLTYRCNLRCLHCYLGGQDISATQPNQELGTEQWIRIIDEIVEAGCLFLLITGGDPLLRRDFVQIYRHAKRKGLLVTVFSNGTLVTDELVQLFVDLPPRSIEISLYGATPETYEQITGIQGSYDHCIQGIERLLAAGIRVRLKTILMTVNRHEFAAIKKKAADYGVPFRFDAAIFARFNGDRSPLLLRVPVQEAVEHEFADGDRQREWLQYYRRLCAASPSDKVYTCGTGISGFHVNAYGKLQPCLMVTDIQYDLLRGDFLTGWKTVIPEVRNRKMLSNNPCRGCDTMSFCGYCPPFFALENDAEEHVSPYLCEMGRLRVQHIHALIRKNSRI